MAAQPGAVAADVHADDPTSLTTRLILREVATLERVLTAEQKGQREIFEARLNGMDKALERAEKYPTAIDGAIKGMMELFDQKLTVVRAEMLAARQVADERYECGKTAISKNEKAMSDLVEKNSEIASTTMTAMSGRIDDNKTRLGAIEGRTKGMGDVWGWGMGVLGLLAAAISVAVFALK